MFKERSELVAMQVEVVAFVLVLCERGCREKWNFLIENLLVSSRFDIECSRIGKPQEIVRAARSNPAAQGRVPPMEDISLLELTTRTLEEVGPGSGRVAMEKGENVLELVAKSECTARLVEAGSR
jgi:hypothetical protein